MWSFCRPDQDADAYPPLDEIVFNTQRLVRVERQIDDATLVHHEPHAETIKVSAKSIVDFVRVLDETAYYALACYLAGCDNPRYFLVEFYKAVESVRHALGGEEKMLSKLRPYGMTKTAYRKFTRVCNDDLHAPIDIARHAPKLGVPLFSVDLRNLVVEPRSRELFQSATVICRCVIDGYLALRTAGGK